MKKLEESRLPKFEESQKEKKEETKEIAKEDAFWHGTIWNNFGWEEEDAFWHGTIWPKQGGLEPTRQGGDVRLLPEEE